MCNQFEFGKCQAASEEDNEKMGIKIMNYAMEGHISFNLNSYVFLTYRTKEVGLVVAGKELEIEDFYKEADDDNKVKIC